MFYFYQLYNIISKHVKRELNMSKLDLLIIKMQYHNEAGY